MLIPEGAVSVLFAIFRPVFIQYRDPAIPVNYSSSAKSINTFIPFAGRDGNSRGSQSDQRDLRIAKSSRLPMTLNFACYSASQRTKISTPVLGHFKLGEVFLFFTPCPHRRCSNAKVTAVEAYYLLIFYFLKAIFLFSTLNCCV